MFFNSAAVFGQSAIGLPVSYEWIGESWSVSALTLRFRPHARIFACLDTANKSKREGKKKKRKTEH